MYVHSIRVDSSSPHVNYMTTYPHCSIDYDKEPSHSCFPSQDRVSTIDKVIYPMGERYPLLSPIVPRDYVFLLEFDLIVCGFSCLGTCESMFIDSAKYDQNLHHHMEYDQFTSSIWVVNPLSSYDFLDVELHLDETILEAMTTDDISWEDMHHILLFFPKLDTL
jgi:hypothetical protein